MTTDPFESSQNAAAATGLARLAATALEVEMGVGVGVGVKVGAVGAEVDLELEVEVEEATEAAGMASAEAFAAGAAVGPTARSLRPPPLGRARSGPARRMRPGEAKEKAWEGWWGGK